MVECLPLSQFILMDQKLHAKLLLRGEKRTFSIYNSKIEKKYNDSTESRYHQHRVSMLSKSIDRMHLNPGSFVIDFGCGNGLFTKILHKKGYKVKGIDPSEHLINSSKKLKGGIDYEIGSVDILEKLDDSSVDALTAFDVLSYLTLDEEKKFFKQTYRILKKGGILLSTMSNELFDFFTFNRYTVNFYKENFGVDVTKLLVFPDKPIRSMQNIRANPYVYPNLLKKRGFQEIDQTFLMYHPKPPLTIKDFNPDDLENRDFVDVDTLPVEEKWKIKYQCSVYCSSSKKI